MSELTQQRIEKILKQINEVFDSQFFDIRVDADNLLVEEDDQFSCLVTFTPKNDLGWEDAITIGKPQLIQFDIWDDGDVRIITNEDTENDVTKEKIYTILYWCEATKSSLSETDIELQLKTAMESADAATLIVLEREKEIAELNETLRSIMVGHYPESLWRRNKHLEKALEIHKLELERLESYNHELRYDIGILRQKVSPDESTGATVWHWQHDGYDHLNSMRNGQAVLISSEDLRELILHGEKPESGEYANNLEGK